MAVNLVGVEQGGATLDAVDFIAFVQQKLGQVGATLAGDAGNQSTFFMCSSSKYCSFILDCSLRSKQRHSRVAGQN